jgi:hypothetical protein
MGPVGLAVDLHDDGPIDDAIQEGHRERWIAEVFAPGIEVDVGHQGRGALSAAGVDHLVQEVGGLRGYLAALGMPLPSNKERQSELEASSSG